MVVRTTSHGLPLRLMMVQPIGVGKIPLPSNSSELKIHAVIEEEIFYPAVRRQLSEDVMNEADEEHHVARVLIAELDREGRGDDHREVNSPCWLRACATISAKKRAKCCRRPSRSTSISKL